MWVCTSINYTKARANLEPGYWWSRLSYQIDHNSIPISGIFKNDYSKIKVRTDSKGALSFISFGIIEPILVILKTEYRLSRWIRLAPVSSY